MNNPRVGVGILVFNENKELLLGRRLSSDGIYTYGPPGGHLEFGESFEECAIREVKEETGLDIIDPEFVAITNDIFSEEAKHSVSIFMSVAFPLNQKIIICEPNKILSWEWFPIDNLPDNLFLPLQNLLNDKSYLVNS